MQTWGETCRHRYQWALCYARVQTSLRCGIGALRGPLTHIGRSRRRCSLIRLGFLLRCRGGKCTKPFLRLSVVGRSGITGYWLRRSITNTTVCLGLGCSGRQAPLTRVWAPSIALLRCRQTEHEGWGRDPLHASPRTRFGWPRCNRLKRHTGYYPL